MSENRQKQGAKYTMWMMFKRTMTFLRHFFLVQRYAHFFLTGASGIVLNLGVTWALTTFVFGLESYCIGYFIGIAINLIYNFLIYTFLVFRTTRNHWIRLGGYLLCSLSIASIQILIVRTATEMISKQYYLLVIATTAFFFSIFSFILFKTLLFRDWGKDFG